MHGHDLVVWRSEQTGWVAFDAACPHRGANLANGTVEAGCLRCPYHGWTFDPEGAVQTVPSLAPDAEVPAFRARSWRVEVSQGFVWVAFGAVASAVPRFAVLEFAELQGFTVERVVTASFGWWVENLIDVAHVPFVHPSTYGGASPVVQHGPVEAFDGGFRARVELEERASWAMRLTHGVGSTVRMVSDLTVHAPGMVEFDVDLGGARRQGLVALTCPEDADTLRVWVVSLRNWFTWLPGANAIGAWITRRVLAEDEALYASMLSEGPGVSVPADAASVAWWRMLRESEGLSRSSSGRG